MQETCFGIFVVYIRKSGKNSTLGQRSGLMSREAEPFDNAVNRQPQNDTQTSVAI